MDGTAYIVTDEPSSIPAISMMISTGIPLELGNANFKDLEPTDKEMRIVSTKVARELFGAGASKITGVTVRYPQVACTITYWCKVPSQ